MSLIELRNVSFEYKKDAQTLKNVSFSVDEGEFLCILGHNGSGKSTIAKLITGLIKAKSGEVVIDGTVLSEETIDDVRMKLGIIFQNPDNQFVGITVKDDIAFGLENRNLPREEMLSRIEKYSKLVHMESFLDRNPDSLSGGEKQRVAIAGVLACEPEIIVFDESTSMLDPKSVKEVLDTIKELKKERTIIYITHNLNEALLADKVIVMNRGEVILQGTPKDIFNSQEVLKDAGLDVLTSMKLINKLESLDSNGKKEIVDLLWQLTYEM